MKAAVPEEEKDRSFREESKVHPITLLACLVFLGLASGMWIGMGRDGDVGAAIAESLGGAVAAAISVVLLLAGLFETKTTAVKQCLAVAEKFELDLTKWQVYELAAEWFAMDVFKSFVAFVQQTKPELIPAGTFISTGGKATATACRRLVAHLWQLGESEPVGAETQAEAV